MVNVNYDEVHDWQTLLPASRQHIDEMAHFLEGRQGGSVADFKRWLTVVLDEMTRMMSQRRPVKPRTEILYIDYKPYTDERDQQRVENYDPVLYDPANDLDENHVYGGLYLMDYEDLLGRPVQVDSQGEFWRGMAELFWVMTFFGTTDAQRKAEKDKMDREWAHSDAFFSRCEQIRAILKQYEQDHDYENDPQAAAIIDKFEVLPMGREVYDPELEDSYNEEEFDPALLAEFEAFFDVKID